jgi:SAM-dependent methyltransferase
MTSETRSFPQLPERIVSEVARHQAAEMRGVTPADPVQLALARLSFERAAEQFGRFRHLLPAGGGRILEIGSGFGAFVAYALAWEQVDAYGIEPDAEALAVSTQVIAEIAPQAGRMPVMQGVGEQMPFPDNSFDLVCSFNVFEHVAVPEHVLAESVRILKPGGYLYFNFPSYGTWWEGHYGVLWLPYLPRWAARLYVALLGRSPHFIDTLQFVTYPRLMRMLAPLRSQIEVLDTGKALWEERVRTAGFSEWSQLSRLKRWVRLVHRLRLVEPLIAVGHYLHWETPFALVLRKR